MGTFSTQGHSMGPNRILQGPGGTPLDLMRPKGMPRGPWDPPGPNRTLCDSPAYPDPQVPWDPLTPLRSSPPGLRALGVGGGGLHHPAGEETPHHHLPPCPAARVPGESPGTPPIPRGPRHSGPVTAPPASPPIPFCTIPTVQSDEALPVTLTTPRPIRAHGQWGGRTAVAMVTVVSPGQRHGNGASRGPRRQRREGPGGHTRVHSPVTVGARRHTRAHPCGLASVCVCRRRHSDRRVHVRLGSSVHTCPDAHACPGVCTHMSSHTLSHAYRPMCASTCPHCLLVHRTVLVHVPVCTCVTMRVPPCTHVLGRVGAGVRPGRVLPAVGSGGGPGPRGAAEGRHPSLHHRAAGAGTGPLPRYTRVRVAMGQAWGLHMPVGGRRTHVGACKGHARVREHARGRVLEGCARGVLYTRGAHV